MSYLMLGIVVVSVETIYENLVTFEIRKLAEFLYEFCKATNAIARIHRMLENTKHQQLPLLQLCSFAKLIAIVVVPSSM